MSYSKTLILVEKPSVASEFARALGVATRGNGFFENDDYIITWAIGHLLKPLDPEDYDKKWKKWNLETLPIIPAKVSYRPESRTKKQLDIVLTQLKRLEVSKIIVATDAGREGELIARTILEWARVQRKESYRFWTSQALTNSVIKSELQRIVPLAQFDRLYRAGQARQTADWLVGLNLSRLATLRLGELFSVGRVQTAVLSMLVQRKKEIDRFLSTPYYHLKGKFCFSKGGLEALWFDPEKKQESSKIEKKEIAEALAQQLLGKKAVVKEVNKEKKKDPPPQLFSLTELQRTANRLFGFSAKKTLDLAQRLYEKDKVFSYPRTDSRVLGNKSFPQVQKLLEEFKVDHPAYFHYFDPNKVSFKNRLVFNDAKLTDHHALIPLKNYHGDPHSDQGKIFDLVLRRFVAAFSKDYCYLETSIVLQVATDHYFRTAENRVLEAGWRGLGKLDNDKILPELAPLEEGIAEDLRVEDKKTMPPAEYTENTLLKDMVNPARLVQEAEYKKVFRGEVGLGTQATRAQIIETLLSRKYIERKGKILSPLEKGVVLIDVLNKMKVSTVLTSPSQTALWELYLEGIANGEKQVDPFIDSIKDFVKKTTIEWKEQEIDLEYTSQKMTGEKKEIKSDGRAILGKCPLCQGDVIENSKAFACNRWKVGCKFTIWKTIASKQISERQVTKLIKGRQTDMLKGWKSKQGKSFSARLVLNDQGLIVFAFS